MLLNLRIVPRLLFVGLAGHASMMMAQGTFTATGSMTAARSGHTATLLLDGRVLIAGGRQCAGLCSSIPPTAELYDPSTSIFTATGNMTKPRAGASAILLADGKVLIAGGYDGSYAGSHGLVSAELYDPSTGAFTATGDMIAPGGAGILLENGEVLIFGEKTAQLYDPVTSTFSDAGAYAGDVPRVFSTTMLGNGTVLVIGDPGLNGVGGMRADVYAPKSEKFSVTGPMPDFWRDSYSATLLTNGKVLISGGDDDWSYLSSAEIYDPANGSFTATAGPMTTYRDFSPAALLPDGTVLVAGGQLYGGGADARAEIFDPASATFSATGSMTMPRFAFTATLLPDGTVLIAGGLPYYTSPTATAELYKPLLLQAAPSLLSLSGTGQGQGAIQHADTYQVASATDPAVVGEALVIYCDGLADGSVIPPQVAIGGRMAEVLWFGNTPGFPGLNQVNVRVPSGVAAGPDISVRLTYLNRPSNKVTIGVR
jgi:hypothetical protein